MVIPGGPFPPINVGQQEYEYDEKHRKIIASMLCGEEYGSDLVSGLRTYPVDKPLVYSPTFVPLAYVRNNFHFIEDDVYVKNTFFVKTWLINNIDLHAVLLSRDGSYGFCTWRQLYFHHNNPKVRFLHDNGIVSSDYVGLNDKKILEGPVFGTTIFTGGVVGKLDNSSKEVVFDNLMDFESSYTNEIVLFNSDDIVLRGTQVDLKSDGWEVMKERFSPSTRDSGKNLKYDITHSVVLRQSNPERIISDKKYLKSIQLGSEGVFLSVYYGEDIFPDRYTICKKVARVRDKYIDDWRMNTRDFFSDYEIGWMGNPKDMRREGNFITCLLDEVTNNKFAPRSRFPLVSVYYGQEQKTVALVTTYYDSGELSTRKIFNSSFSVLPCISYSFYYTDQFILFLNSRYFGYRINKHIGYNPFHDSYEDYVKDFKIKSQGYSFVRNRDGFVDGIGPEYCEASFYDSEGFVGLRKFQKELHPDLKQHKFSFKVSVLTSPWLKRGFFPAERVTQIASLLAKEYKYSVYGVNYTPSISYTRCTELPNYSNIFQTFVDNVMSPGVFMNTIKSGVAVGFPIYRLKLDVNGDRKFYDLHYNNFGLSTNRRNILIGSVHDFYLPFESVFDLQSYLKPIHKNFMFAQDHNDNYSIYTTPSVTLSAHSSNDTCSPNHSFCIVKEDIRGRDFELANHNFFSEIVNFYLKNSKTTYFESKPETDFIAAEAGVVYYMDVVLKRRGVVLSEGRGDSVSPRRGEVYGPPTCPDSSLPYEILDTQVHAYAVSLTADPAYAPFTPPYFYGDAIARLSFDPMEVDNTLKIGETKKFSLDEILSNVKMRIYKNTELYGTKSYENYNIFIPNYSTVENEYTGLFNTIDWNSYYNASSFPEIYEKIVGGSVPGVLFLSGCMKIDQSVNLFSKKKLPIMGLNGKEIYSWCIETKFETPILDFSMHSSLSVDNMPQKNEIGEYEKIEKSDRARGLWYDYGVEPKPEEGLFLELRESFPDRYEENMSVFSINEELFEKCFTSEPALYLYWDNDVYEFDVHVPGYKLVLHLVSNYDTVVAFSHTNSCDDSGTGSFTFDDTTWLTGKPVKRGEIYDISLTSLEISICSITNNFPRYSIIRAHSPLAMSRNCNLELRVVPQEGCYISSNEPASSSFTLSDFVKNNRPVYSMLLKFYNNLNINGKKKRYGSLIKLCGFQGGEKKIGQVKDSQDLKELLVLVPYVIRNNEKRYFLIDKNKIKNQVESYQKNGYSYKTIYGDEIKLTSIVDLYNKMGEYWFPEEYDFRNYNVDSRVMFAVEISRKINKQDLLDLWQNILPMSLREIQKIEVEKEILLEDYEIFGTEKIPDDIKFEIFVSPLRAMQNYYDILPSMTKDRKVEEIYYNWPYSYIRLCEYVKIGMSVYYEL